MKKSIEYIDTRIYPCLIAEKKALNFKRSTCKIQKFKDKVKFSIEAKDNTAMRASSYSVNNLITVFDNTKRVIKDGY